MSELNTYFMFGESKIKRNKKDAAEVRAKAKAILDKALDEIGELGCVVLWKDKETGETGRIDGKVDFSIYKLDISDRDMHEN